MSKVWWCAAAVAMVVSMASVPAALAAPGPTVTIRIEGEYGTLVPRTTVTTSTDQVPHGDHCPGTSVAGAIEVATHGNWDGKTYTSTIMGEKHPDPPDFSRSDYWAEWLNNRYGNGICTDMLSSGDDVLLHVDFSPPPGYASTVFPLVIESVPGSVQRGRAFTVTAVEYRTDGTPGTGTRTPTSGVTISGGGASAVTGSDGTATLSMPTKGTFALRATKPHERSATYAVCVHDGNDGSCDTGGPGPGGRNGRDRILPLARIDDPHLGQRFAHGHGPRLLKGGVTVGRGGLRAVYFRLWSHRRGRCYFYSGRLEELQRATCGARRELVPAGSGPSWSYLLPFSLPPGHYWLDAVAVDRSGKRGSLLSGRNRIDFYVR